ncbi:MAG: hypothetical protein ABJA10_09025 [Aestuariivirga sp.]
MRPLDLFSYEFAEEVLLAMGDNPGAEPSLLYPNETPKAKALRAAFNRKALRLVDAVSSIAKAREIRLRT